MTQDQVEPDPKYQQQNQPYGDVNTLVSAFLMRSGKLMVRAYHRVFILICRQGMPSKWFGVRTGVQASVILRTEFMPFLDTVREENS